MNGKRIREVRRALGLTALEVAKRTNGMLSPSTLSQIECGVRNDIKLSQAIALANALDIPIELIEDLGTSAKALAIGAEIVNARTRLKRELENESMFRPFKRNVHND